MIQVYELNELLEKLQFETPNCGGAYGFWKIELDYPGNLTERVGQYLTRFAEQADAADLALEKVSDFDEYLAQKLHDWSNHRTSLDCREEVTENYTALEMEFREKMHLFLEQEGVLEVYVISSETTHYSFGEDHVNDDTLIQTAGGFYVLHFGWSS